MNIRRIGALVALALGSIMLSATGCGSSAADVCDEKCDCEGCNSDEYDLCTITTEAAIDRADAYDCSDKYDALEECQLKRSRCDDRSWHLEKDDCSGERKVLSDCIEDGSRL
jgi:hypothetical protein